MKAVLPGIVRRTVERAFLRRALGACGRGVVFGRGIVVRQARRIRVGDEVVVDDRCLLDACAPGEAGITLGNRVVLGPDTSLSCRGGDIELGDGVSVGARCEVTSSAGVSVGPDCVFSARCRIGFPVEEEGGLATGAGTVASTAVGIRIGRGVWMAPGARVQDGVAIGDDAMIAAGAVVCSDVPDRAVVLGDPARVVGTRDSGG